VDDSRVLAGIRVFEMSIAVAAPSCGRYLAFHGAEVIKVESKTSPDVARLFGSAWARGEELADVFCDTSPYLPEMSSGKRSIGLELKHPDGLAAAKRLIATCDVLLTNYATPAMRALGLGYEDVREINPNIIYAAMPGFGSEPGRPYYEFRAFGPNQAPLVGLDALTGYADQEPAGVATFAPPDYVGGLHACLAILSALEQRDVTGNSAFLDISQFETTVSFLGPFVAERSLGGTGPERDGNRLESAAPVGSYPCSGHDSFVAVCVDSDQAWKALGGVAGSPEWAADVRFSTLAGRRENHDEIDGDVAEWTRQHSADEVASWLQAVGVPAYPVHDHRGVLLDPQVRDRQWFQVKPAKRMGRDLLSGHPIHLSETPASVDRAGPSMGEDTRQVLVDAAAMTEDEVSAAIASGGAFEDAEPDTVLSRPYDPFLVALGVIDPETAE
jgi:benzylsuccinate CoA-transferase BbsF subunit